MFSSETAIFENTNVCGMPTSVSLPVWIASIVLSVSCLSTATDVKLCGIDNIVELTAGKNTSTICKAEGEIHWRLHLARIGTNVSFLLANCTEEDCIPAFFKETFSASVMDAHTKIITITTENNTKIQDNIRIVSSTLECVYVNKTNTETAARCGLNYVYPSENVSCEGVTTLGSVIVSCVIGSAYSSRGIYRCQLFSRKHWESLGIVDMVTSPTSVKITTTEVKVSGSCQLNTTLPSEEDCFDSFVTVSPGGRNYSVKLKDATYTTCFLVNGRKNTTVMEGDHVSFICISHDQPSPEIYIFNHDNDSVVCRESTLLNYTFIARCEDTAAYSCGNKATSATINLYVNCTPRNLLLTHLDAVNDESNQVVITFEVIAFPAPHQCNLWFIGSSVSNTEAAYEKIEGSMNNFTCESFTRHRYLYRCSLTVLNFPSHLRNGKYKIQVINEAGNENFTVAHAAKDQQSNYAALSGGVITAVVVVILAAVFIVVRRRRRDAKGDTSSDFSSCDTVPLNVRGLGYGWWTSPRPTSTPGSEVDKGRWTNQDGLTYVSLNFNNRKLNRAPKYEPTEYSTVKAVQTQMHSP